MKIVKWVFAILAYLTILHAIMVFFAIMEVHNDPHGGSTVMYGIEFSSFESPGAKQLLAHSVWTTLLAVGCLLQTRRKIPKETHCRSCDYILKGLSEPKCPECGERI